jgi:hypothetical protein
MDHDGIHQLFADALALVGRQHAVGPQEPEPAAVLREREPDDDTVVSRDPATGWILPEEVPRSIDPLRRLGFRARLCRRLADPSAELVRLEKRHRRRALGGLDVLDLQRSHPHVHQLIIARGRDTSVCRVSPERVHRGCDIADLPGLTFGHLPEHLDGAAEPEPPQNRPAHGRPAVDEPRSVEASTPCTCSSVLESPGWATRLAASVPAAPLQVQPDREVVVGELRLSVGRPWTVPSVATSANRVTVNRA